MPSRSSIADSRWAPAARLVKMKGSSDALVGLLSWIVWELRVTPTSLPTPNSPTTTKPEMVPTAVDLAKRYAHAIFVLKPFPLPSMQPRLRSGLKEVRADIPFVAIHDAARPCVSEVWIDAVFAKAKLTGAAILAIPCNATLKRVSAEQVIEATVPRERLWLAQTPQVFRTELLRTAYAAHANPVQATDDASIVETHGHSVHIVEGSPLNIKVTTKADLKFAELALKSLPKKNPLW